VLWAVALLTVLLGALVESTFGPEAVIHFRVACDA